MRDISIAAATVDDEDVNDEHGDVEDDGGKNVDGEEGDGKDVGDEDGIGQGDDIESSGLFTEEQAIPSGSVVCEDSSTVEVDVSIFFFLKDCRKNE
ncbi:unnamed protein product [Rotaria sp. Silwood1]|nr:unnamed protein product [Rotaria sp. Silwood1]